VIKSEAFSATAGSAKSVLLPGMAGNFASPPPLIGSGANGPE
jgi:hypothetical protein